EIECEEDFPLEKLEKVVYECGYTLSEELKLHSEKKEEVIDSTKPDYFEIGLIILVLVVVFWVLKQLEITRLFPDFGSQVNVFIAILLGVVASLSTCLALTGGIVMSFGSMVHIHEGRKNHFIARAIPHIYFHIGRVGGFMLLGGLLGLIGSKINYSLSFTGYLTILIAFVMLYIGLQILGIVPNISKLGFHLPKFLSRRIHDIDGNGNHFAPIVIGVLTFFLPCGFTQSMQLAAVVSGNFVTGALIMGAFALGTVPVLLSVGIGSTYAKKEKAAFFNRIIGVIIIFFSLHSFNSGLVLAGSSVTIDFWNRSG
ncbi:sulfite exporter TauE/SafE family protein, partial [Patescibacteria group bacterium]|nr:sulfite exporter TauE/SafE family protein [Patescibacteria group bacterium]